MTQIVRAEPVTYHGKMRHVGYHRHNLVALLFSMRLASLAGALLLVLALGISSATGEEKQAGDIVSVDGTVFVRSDPKDKPSAKMHLAKAGDFILSKDVINTGSDGRIKILMKDKTIIDLGPSALFKVEDFKGKAGMPDREVDVSMVYGTMRASVTQKIQGKGKFKVRTPSATMGVRGTEFIVKSEIGDMKDVSKLLNNSSGTLPPKNLSEMVGANAGSMGTKTGTASTQVTVLQGQVDVGKKDFNASAAAASFSQDVVRLKAGSQVEATRAELTLSSTKTVDPGQMKAISSESKIVDTTFQKTVVVENTGGNGRSPASDGSSSSSAPAAAVHQALTSADVPLPAPPAVKPSEMNIPGALGSTQIFTQPNINTTGTIKHLHIVITAN